MRTIKVNTINIWEIDESLHKYIKTEYDYISREEQNYVFYKNTLRTIPELLSVYLGYCKNSDILIITTE